MPPVAIAHVSDPRSISESIKMITKASLYTFIYGTRVGNAPPPPYLKFRSSSAFIISTIVIAIFTVSILESCGSNVENLTRAGHIPLFYGSACPALCFHGQSRHSGKGFAEMDVCVSECVWSYSCSGSS
jgi:hypothetical protein